MWLIMMPGDHAVTTILNGLIVSCEQPQNCLDVVGKLSWKIKELESLMLGSFSRKLETTQWEQLFNFNLKFSDIFKLRDVNSRRVSVKIVKYNAIGIEILWLISIPIMSFSTFLNETRLSFAIFVRCSILAIEKGSFGFNVVVATWPRCILQFWMSTTACRF